MQLIKFLIENAGEKILWKTQIMIHRAIRNYSRLIEDTKN